jgi:hypothetical protein
MFGWVGVARSAAEACLRGFDPDLITSADAAALVGQLSELERFVVACRVLAAGRAATGNGWQGDGHRSADEWLAAQTGQSRADAADALRTAEALPSCPATAAALRAGELSAQQVAAVASAASVDPAAEAALLDQARTATVEHLRRAARDARASATADAQMAAQRRVHQSRHCRTWTDAEGASCGRWRLTADAGAVVAAALDAHHDRLFTAARTEGRRERYDALHADALVAMAQASTSDAGTGTGGGGGGGGGHADGSAAPGGTGGPGGVQATVVVRVDHAALRRGRTVAGEECSIDGTGPVPVATAARIACDAVVVALLADGDRICDVRLAGRTVPTRTDRQGPRLRRPRLRRHPPPRDTPPPTRRSGWPHQPRQPVPHLHLAPRSDHLPGSGSDAHRWPLGLPPRR